MNETATAWITAAGVVLGAAAWVVLAWRAPREGRRLCATDPAPATACAVTSGRVGASADLFAVALALGVALRLAFVFLNPPGNAPDERSHVNFARYLWQRGALPVQTCTTGDPSNEWEYYQPPAYYVLVAPVWGAARALFGDDAALRALRLASVALWVATLFLVRAILNNLRVADAAARAAVFALAALLPTYVFISSSVNSDNLVAPLGALALWMLTRDDPLRGLRPLALGAAIGLALLAKLNAAAVAVTVGVALLLRLQRPGGNRLGLLARVAAVVLVAAALLVPWLARNYRLYGDLTGEERFNRSYASHRSVPSALLRKSLDITRTFWGVAGVVNTVRFPPAPGLIVMLAAGVGLICAATYRRRDFGELFAGTRDVWLPFSLGILVNLALVLRLGLAYDQGQGRFLLVMLAPIALWIAAGLRMLPGAGSRKFPAHVVGAFAAYAISFAAYSLCLLQAPPPA